MRPSIAAAVALLVLAALAAPPAHSAPVVVESTNAAETAVDLLDDAGDTLVFTLDGAKYSQAAGPIRSAYVQLLRAGERPIEVAMAPGTQKNWTASLPVASPDLVVGTWQVRFWALRDAGSAALANRTLQVTARDTSAPQLALAETETAPVVLGPGGSVDLTVRDPLLRSVTVEHSGLVPVPLPAPYSFHGGSLPEGRTEVTFKATDRAAHTSTLKVDVVRDTVAPLLNLTVPEHVYAGVPFLVYARVTEMGPYTLRFSVNGTTQPDVTVAGSVAQGVNRSTAFTVTPNATGNLSLGVQAVDQVGFVAVGGVELRVEEPVTDLRLSRLRATPDGPLFAQRPVTFTATLEQEEGVATLAVPVTLEVGGKSFSTVEQVPATGPRLLTWEVQLPGGRHAAKAVAAVPESANETAPGDEEDAAQVEVFLGRVLHDGTAYDIRAGDNGLPTVAVVEGGTRTYPLEIVDSGKGVAYRFTLSDNRTVDWDPLDPLGDKASSTTTNTTSSTSSATKDKPAAAAGPLVALLVVALAAMAQRRRLK